MCQVRRVVTATPNDNRNWIVRMNFSGIYSHSENSCPLTKVGSYNVISNEHRNGKPGNGEMFEIHLTKVISFSRAFGNLEKLHGRQARDRD